jgi:hypothetical protein
MGWREQGAGYRNSLWQLAQYERREAYLRAAAGAITFLAIPALPVAVLAASVYAVHTHGAQLALGVLLIAATTTSGWLWKRRLWERPVIDRLAEWQSRNPEMSEVGVTLADADVDRAHIVLRHAHLYPVFFRQSNHIPDAPELDHYIGVALPLIVPQVEFEEVAEQTRSALRDAGIRARVVGVDVP